MREAKIRYEIEEIDDRWDAISHIGNQSNYTYEVTDEPFDIETAHLYRYDKNIQAWVEGEIDEETGEWKLKSE